MIRISTVTAAAIALHATEQDWVIFLQCQPPTGVWPIKIEAVAGKKLVSRLNTVAVDNPFDILLVGMLTTFQAKDVEHALHQEFADDQIHDGWFNPSMQLFTFIENSAQEALKMLMEQTKPGALSDEIVDIEEIARILGISVPTVRRMVGSKEIPFFRVGKRTLRFVPSDVMASLVKRG